MKEYNPTAEKLARWIQPTLLYLRLCDGAGWQAVPCFSRPSVDRPGRGLDYYTSRCTSCMHAQCRSDMTIMSYGVFYERSREHWGFHFYSQWVLDSLYRKTVDDDCLALQLLFVHNVLAYFSGRARFLSAILDTSLALFGLRASALASRCHAH